MEVSNRQDQYFSESDRMQTSSLFHSFCQFRGRGQLGQSAGPDSGGLGPSLSLCICHRLLDNKMLVHRRATLSRKHSVCGLGHKLERFQGTWMLRVVVLHVTEQNANPLWALLSSLARLRTGSAPCDCTTSDLVTWVPGRKGNP